MRRASFSCLFLLGAWISSTHDFLQNDKGEGRRRSVSLGMRQAFYLSRMSIGRFERAFGHKMTCGTGHFPGTFVGVAVQFSKHELEHVVEY